jgi:hypothetical protein
MVADGLVPDVRKTIGAVRRDRAVLALIRRLDAGAPDPR